MQFLSDIFIRCPDCQGRRYRAHLLEITIGPKTEFVLSSRGKNSSARPVSKNPDLPEKSIADILETSVDDAITFLEALEVPSARKAVAKLQLLQEVGLGYLRLGQPINTLSGGESQRLKLVSHLAEFNQKQKASLKPTLFLFDEPTTGLHFDDVRVLLLAFQKMVDQGHSVVVVEHNLDVIKCADWVIDIGPEAGEKGGKIVAEGPPEEILLCPESHTGAALREAVE